MHIIKFRKIYYVLSAVITGAALLAVFGWGIRFGLDFTGGSSIDYSFEESTPSTSEVRAQLAEFDFLGDYTLRTIGDDSVVLRTQTLTDEQKEVVSSTLVKTLGAKEERFSTIGPSLGAELRTNAIVSVLVAIFFIVLFIAFAFRHVSKPVPSWKYGIITVIALAHDIIVPLGVFAAMGYFLGIEVDTLFVVALLVIIGYSINDTIVVFDRIRENLAAVPDVKKRIANFENIVGKSLNETIARSINTSLTTTIALLALYYFGGTVTQPFAVALIAGVFAGTYSSIFLAAPLLVSMKK
jgi:preprotein translocase subunit SecF